MTGQESPQKSDNTRPYRLVTGGLMLLWLGMGLLGGLHNLRQAKQESRSALKRDAQILVNAVSPMQLALLARGQFLHVDIANKYLRAWLERQNTALQVRFYVRGTEDQGYHVVLDSTLPDLKPQWFAENPGDEHWRLLESARRTGAPAFAVIETGGISHTHLAHPVILEGETASRAVFVLFRPSPAGRLPQLSGGKTVLFVTALLLIGTPLFAGYLRRYFLLLGKHTKGQQDLFVIFLLMLCFTGAAVWMVYLVENQGLQKRFALESHAFTNQVLEELLQLRDLEIPAWQGYYKGSDDIDAGEFSTFAASLQLRSHAREWLWVDWVPDDPAGEDLTGSFSAPVRYRFPAGEDLPGRDLASDPILLEYLRESLQRQVALASNPVDLFGAGRGISLIFLPFFSKPDSSRPEGWISAVVDWSSLLQHASFSQVLENPALSLRLEMLAPIRSEKYLLGTVDQPHPSSLLQHQKVFFGFGRVFVVTASPTDAYFHASDHTLSQAVAVVGLLFTCVLTWAFRQKVRITAGLEREVRKRTEALEAANEQYRLLVDNSMHGILALELLGAEDGSPRDLRFISVNPVFRKRFGLTGGDPCGKLASACLPVLLSPVILNAFADVMRRQRAVSIDFSISSPSPMDFLITAYSLGDQRLAVVFNDVSEQKKNERKNEELTAQLLHSQKMESIGRLAGGVAHDFNNTLQIILGNADMALNFHEPKPAVRQALEEIREAARKSSRLTHQLLAFARKQKIVPRVIDLNEEVRQSMKMIRRLLSEDIALEWVPAEHLDPIYMDPGQLDQILFNLCVNSRDALGPAGRIIVSTGRYELGEEESLKYPESSPGPYARLSIADNGHGMSHDLMDKIFEPFFTTKAQGQGTGLGLATVLGIVMQNHGFISLESSVHQGSTFHVNLPFSVLEGGAEEPAPPDASPRPVTGQVLVVEDEDMVLQMATLILRKLGYTVTSCASATEALRLLETMPEAPDILLTDVIMPDLNGADLARAYLEKHPGMKIVFMSGYTADVVARQGILLEEEGNFLQKPFTLESLARKFQEILSR